MEPRVSVHDAAQDHGRVFDETFGHFADTRMAKRCILRDTDRLARD